MLLLRENGALQFDVLFENGPWALSEAKKRAAVTETMGSGADMVLDSASEEGRQHCNQPSRIAQSVARGKAVSNSGRSGARIRQASDGYEKRAANTQAAEGVRKRRCHNKSDGPRSVPCGFGVGSKPLRQGNVYGDNVGAENVHNETPRRIHKSTRPGNVAGERAAFYCCFEACERQHRAVSGTLGRHFKQLREVDGPHAEDAPGMAKLPCGPAKAVCTDKVPRPLFHGPGALGRTRITRAAAEEEQRRLPLQKVSVGTLSLDWAMRRLNSRAPRRFGAVWRNALQTPEPHSSSHKPDLRINEADAKEMERDGVIFEASKKPTKG
ncbi:hypothetical protein ERJ75_001605700 [Trypanosoma vivax]|nr:hypothetical protein ERJ75_001605700 [Trypanosoma vivax]